jgi:glycine cleavage system H lipoate-binding protein
MDAPRKCFVVPPEEQRCIWMDAGILPYQLCTQKNHCDDCIIDEAMRMRMDSKWEWSEEVRGGSVLSVEPKTLAEGFRYSRNHWWIRKTSPGQFRLGLEPGIVEVLLNIKGIVFPSAQSIRKGQACAWAVMDSGTLPLESPVGGVLVAVNHDLVAKPHLLAMRPFHDGWICEMEIEDPDAIDRSWMEVGEALPKYAADQQRFSLLLSEASRGRRLSAASGVNDDRISLKSSVDRLGPARYLSLVRQCFGWTGFSARP